MKNDGTFEQFPVLSKSNGCFVIRPATVQDEDALYFVCLKTGNSGADGSAFYNDLRVLGRRYVENFLNVPDWKTRWVGPYIHLEQDLAFVLEDDQGVCGYVLGAFDSQQFYERYLNEWIPKMKQIYPSIPNGSNI